MDTNAGPSSSRLHYTSFTPRHRLVSPSTAMIPPSPKRARQTPSPSDQSPSFLPSSSSQPQCLPSNSTSSTSRHRTRPTRPTLADKRAVTFDRHVMTSPVRGSEVGGGLGADFKADGGLARRREMSVPLLSQTLSHFSLSHTSPPSPQNARAPRTPAQMQAILPTMEPFKTPKSHSRACPWTPAPPLPTDAAYPSTAPLPHAATFLGSPFSSKTSRGGYRYNSQIDSPTRVMTAMTERLPQGAFHQLDWAGRSEWMVDACLPDEMDDGAALPLSGGVTAGRTRRDTSGSTSSVGSMDDLSGSGTSSASLLSLGRSSDEHRVRPGVTIWDDHLLDEEHHTDRPARTLFVPSSDSEGALEIAIKPKKASPTRSRKSKSPSQSPLDSRETRRSIIMPFVSPVTTQLPRSSSKTPFTSFIPRFLARRPPLSRSTSNATAKGDEDMTDTEDCSSPSARCVAPSSSTLCDTPTIQLNQKTGLVGLGIMTVGSAEMDRSFSSDSSGCISSPSKPPSAKASNSQINTLALTPSSNSCTRNRSNTANFKVIQAKAPPSTSTLERTKPMRPLLRRGITEPRLAPKADSSFLHPHAVQTPPTALFEDIKPSPAAFASTGLVKKKSTLPMFSIPQFMNKSSPVRTEEGDSPISPLKSQFGAGSIETILPERGTASQASSANTGSTAGSVQAAQRTRGLRRKGSTMFASGSCGSIGDKGFSPATPTKPAMQPAPFGLGIVTPSPVSSHTYYPFASSTSAFGLSTPPQPGTSPVCETSTSTMQTQAIPDRLKQHRGPIARASNPMLVASYRAQTGTKENLVIGPKNRLDKDFVLVQSLGAGAFSQVWKVKDRKEGKLWAVKAGKPYTGVKNRLRQLEEVSILHSLSRDPHPNVITFIDSWEYQQRLYLRTEVAECGDLARFLEALGDSGGLGETRCWKLLSELSGALQHVHSRSIIHLDVKPSNILITRTGSLKLADFGMSTISDETGHAAALSPALPQMQSDGGFTWLDIEEESIQKHGPPAPLDTVPSPHIDREVEGDREYLCPEALNDGIVGREADTFSLGIMLLECALNVVLPPNGDGWIKLRNDDLSDLAEHYERRECGDMRQVNKATGLPIISDQMMGIVQGMMQSDIGGRMRLDQVESLRGVERARRGRAEGWLGTACVEEDEMALAKLVDAWRPRALEMK